MRKNRNSFSGLILTSLLSFLPSTIFPYLFLLPSSFPICLPLSSSHFLLQLSLSPLFLPNSSAFVFLFYPSSVPFFHYLLPKLQSCQCLQRTLLCDKVVATREMKYCKYSPSLESWNVRLEGYQFT